MLLPPAFQKEQERGAETGNSIQGSTAVFTLTFTCAGLKANAGWTQPLHAIRSTTVFRGGHFHS